MLEGLPIESDTAWAIAFGAIVLFISIVAILKHFFPKL